MDVIAGRKTIGRMEGTLLFGGKTPNSGFIKRFTGYVEQVRSPSPPLLLFLEDSPFHAAAACPSPFLVSLREQYHSLTHTSLPPCARYELQWARIICDHLGRGSYCTRRP